MNSVDSDCNSIEMESKDILTPSSCATLVSELIKGILYRKEQLPYTFDRLKYLITKKNEKGKQEKTNVGLSSVEREFKVAKDRLEALELLFEKTREELADSTKGWVAEIALLFGSTPMTPKQVYRIHLPEISLNHSSANHHERKQLFHLLRSVFLSNNISYMLTKPMSPTNMYVFIRKTSNGREGGGADSNLSKWFIPKNKFQIPKTGEHFHIKFHHPQSFCARCNCQQFKIYSDNGPALAAQEFTTSEKTTGGTSEAEWFQACTTFRGFTDVYVNGVSVADLWLRS